MMTFGLAHRQSSVSLQVDVGLLLDVVDDVLVQLRVDLVLAILVPERAKDASLTTQKNIKLLR